MNTNIANHSKQLAHILGESRGYAELASFDPVGRAREGVHPYEANIPVKKPKRKRDLTAAIALRPKDVYALYGIPSSTLCEMCLHPNPAKRLPSKLVPGRSGRRGLRLIDHEELRRWLEQWRTDRPNCN